MSDRIAGEGASERFEPEAAARRALDALGSTPKLVLAFVAQRNMAGEAARTIASLAGRAPVVVVECRGVLSSQGEHEDGGVAVLALGGDAIDVAPHPLLPDPAAARAEVARAADGATMLALAVTPPLYKPDVVAGALPPKGPAPCVVGGGAARVVMASGDSAPEVVGGVALSIRSTRLRAAAVASPAAKVITPWRKLTEVQGPYLTTADGTPMLEWLQSTAGARTEGSPTFVVIRAHEPESPPLLRTVAGIDPRRGIAVSEPIEEGTEVALGVWDGEAAREDLLARVAELGRALGGGVPAAGLVMTCLGRGVDLFGARDVDAGAVRSRFPGLPFAGMFSQFEVARFDGAPRVHVYTASIGVLYRPS